MTFLMYIFTESGGVVVVLNAYFSGFAGSPIDGIPE
jgi:hypothetical protein